MNITELDNFQLAKAINFNDELNPSIFEGEHMRPDVRTKLLEIADDFREFLGVHELALKDIVISGSNAAYSYTPHSDIDLHLLVDFTELSDSEIYKELFNAKKFQYNQSHNIKIKGYPVELYVQDADEKAATLGEYSVLDDKWVRYPTKQRANLNDGATLQKYEKLKEVVLNALSTDDLSYINSVLSTVKRYRAAGLHEKGEFGPENLAFKMLRTDGLFKALIDKRNELEDKALSLEHIEEEELDEISYQGNLGMEEMFKFYQSASQEQRDKVQQLIKDGRPKAAWKIVQDVVGVNLQGPEFQDEPVTEGVLVELKMGPGHLSKEVAKIIGRYKPTIGVELEVCVPENSERAENNPDIYPNTDMSDIKEFFEEMSDPHAFEVIGSLYNDWTYEKAGEWGTEQLEDITEHPDVQERFKIEAAENMSSTDRDVDHCIALINKANGTEDEDLELTTDIVKEAISRAADWQNQNRQDMSSYDLDEDSEEYDPYIALYYYLYIDDSSSAHEYIKEQLIEDFWNDELPYSENYSLGAWLLEDNITNMYDVWREWQSKGLYWPGIMPSGAGNFSEEMAEMVASGLTELGIDAEVSEYSKASEIWKIMPDESIAPDEDTDSGMEVISPPLPYEEGLDQISTVIGYLTSIGAYTNQSTGLHINVSLAGIKHERLDYAKLVLFVGDRHVQKQFGREFNEYTENSLAAIQQMIDATQGWERDRPQKAANFAKLINNMHKNVNGALKKAFKNINFGKYSSVGIKDNYIEFRSAGGPGYLDDMDRIVQLVDRFVYAYYVATQPKLYKKEYAKKLYKIASDVASGQAPKSSMTLFAGFNSGAITKEDLIKALKAKREPQQVDTGVPADDRIYNMPQDKMEAIMNIADKWELQPQTADLLFQEGMEVEMPKQGQERKAATVVYKNLMQNMHYYRGRQ